MTRTRVFQRGETVPIWAEIKTWAGVYESPDQGVTITITDPDETVQVTAQDMAESSEGIFVYYFTPEATDPLGWWRVRCKGLDGIAEGAKYVIADGGFYLK